MKTERRHSWKNERMCCDHCGVTRRIRSAPPGSGLPIIVEYLVGGVGWTAQRPTCFEAGPIQKSLFGPAPDPAPSPVLVHDCIAFAGEEVMPLRYLMCRKHWYQLPLPYRDEIWRTYRRGQEMGKVRPSRQYLDAVQTAITHIAQLEGRITA